MKKKDPTLFISHCCHLILKAWDVLYTKLPLQRWSRLSYRLRKCGFPTKIHMAMCPIFSRRYLANKINRKYICFKLKKKYLRKRPWNNFWKPMRPISSSSLWGIQCIEFSQPTWTKWSTVLRMLAWTIYVR